MEHPVIVTPMDGDGGGSTSSEKSDRKLPVGTSQELDGKGIGSSRRRVRSIRTESREPPHEDRGEEIIQQAKKRHEAQKRLTDEEREREQLARILTVPWDSLRIGGDKLCGTGSFGQVYRGTYLDLDVAIKVAHDHVIDDDGFLPRFQRECAILSQLHHPNVLSLIAVVIEPRMRRYAIVTDFCPNGDLMAFLTAPAAVHRALGVSLSVRLITKFALDIARGCRFLHTRAHVIQRDLKLANVLVDKFLNALLADFGLSRILRSESGTAHPMTPCGSPAWTAPEIVRLEPYTNKVDVYSFGIMLWQLFTRDEPYPGREAGMDLAMEVAFEGLRPVVPSFCPQEYSDLMKQCWADKPDDRPDFGQIQERLTQMHKSDREASKELRIDLVGNIQSLLRPGGELDVATGRSRGPSPASASHTDEGEDEADSHREASASAAKAGQR
jgi:serine/threonine protein kinase